MTINKAGSSANNSAAIQAQREAEERKRAEEAKRREEERKRAEEAKRKKIEAQKAELKKAQESLKTQKEQKSLEPNAGAAKDGGGVAGGAVTGGVGGALDLLSKNLDINRAFQQNQGVDQDSQGSDSLDAEVTELQSQVAKEIESQQGVGGLSSFAEIGKKIFEAGGQAAERASSTVQYGIAKTSDSVAKAASDLAQKAGLEEGSLGEQALSAVGGVVGGTLGLVGSAGEAMVAAATPQNKWEEMIEGAVGGVDTASGVNGDINEIKEGLQALKKGDKLLRKTSRNTDKIEEAIDAKIKETGSGNKRFKNFEKLGKGLDATGKVTNILALGGNIKDLANGEEVDALELTSNSLGVTETVLEAVKGGGKKAGKEVAEEAAEKGLKKVAGKLLPGVSIAVDACDVVTGTKEVMGAIEDWENAETTEERLGAVVDGLAGACDAISGVAGIVGNFFPPAKIVSGACSLFSTGLSFLGGLFD